MTNGTYSNTDYFDLCPTWEIEIEPMFLVHPVKGCNRDCSLDSLLDGFRNKCRPPPN